MAYAAKDYIMLCVDVGPCMDIAPPSGGDTHLEMAVQVANQIVQQKMFAGSKDFVGLVLFGTPDTDNELAVADGGYENITVAYQPAQPTLEFLQYINNHIRPGETSGDFIDALVVSMDCLVKATASLKRVGEKKIYLLTNAGSEYSDDGLGQICVGLKNKNIELVVVGPDLDSPGDGDGDGAGRGGGGDSPGDSPGPSHRPHPSSSVMKKTDQQIAGERVLSRVVEEVEGVSFSFNEALQVATFIRKNAKRPTCRFSGSLEIGSKLKIPVKIFTKTMEERPASWKKLSAISQASANPGTMAVKMHRSFHLKDEDETEVDMENVVKGYRYGKSLIPISDADELAMKMESERGLSLLGFTDIKNIKWHQIVGNSVQCLVADSSKQGADQTLSAFIHGMYETNTVGVLRYVYRKNSPPKLMAAMPKIKADLECLYLFQLPYMEDTRQYVFGSLPVKGAEPSDEQKAAMAKFIDNMDLMTADVDEDGQPCEAVKPKRMCNPVIQRTFQCIAHRSLHPDEPVPEVDENILKMLGPSQAQLDKCKDDIQQLKELFPMQRVVKTKDDGGAAEAWKKTTELDLDAEAPPSKRPRVDEDTDFSMASLARGEITQVGTLDPVSDYRTLIGKKDVDNFGSASKQMQEVTLRLVKESFGETYYDKALDCVKVLRSEAVSHSKSDMFNKFLKEMKSDFIGTRYSAFWSKVVGESISLVTSNESGESSVSQEDAKQFLEGSLDAQEPSPPPPEETDDAEDLLAMM